MENKNVYQKLMEVQSKLKAPKSQYNSFGKYSYRSCEDILEALKPLLNEVGAIVNISDQVKLIGDRYYIEATAMFLDANTGDSIISKAIAREDESKKGQDLAQLSGATSSYARKYALNGLFAIDDNKDSDATNTHSKDIKPNMAPVSGLSEAQLKRLLAIGNKSGFNKDTIVKTVKKLYGCELKDMTREQYNEVCNRLESKGGK